ncbi:hypothetical protein EZBTHKR_0871 [Elizabethkingia anophelis]|nr:hypothetical protein EZBTHKR_0871 [Elizabethkingia anophelis]
MTQTEIKPSETEIKQDGMKKADPKICPHETVNTISKTTN